MLPHDLVGVRFGRLAVQSRGANNKYGRAQWLCRCDCGTQKVVAAALLKNGHVASCGCLSNDWIKANARRIAIKHGQTKTRAHRCWASMLTRCLRPSHDQYHRYGGRGISVCDQWLTFPGFFSDMGVAPSERHTIDRIDVNGNYEPGNCRWATVREQCRNKRNNRRIEAFGDRKTAGEWSEDWRCAVNENTIKIRIRTGWAAEMAISTPSLRAQKRLPTLKNESSSASP